MTTDFTAREPAMSPADAEDSMFGSTPIWDRKRKPSRSGGKRAAVEPRAFAPAAQTANHVAQPTRRDIAAESTPTLSTLGVHDPNVTAPIIRPGATQVRGAAGGTPITIAAVVGAAALLGAVGWFVTRDNSGIPELAPDTNVRVVAEAPVATADPVAVAANTAAPLPVATPARRVTAAPRVRPAAVSAGDTGVNASTTLPDGPRSYNSLNPSATPQPVVPTPPVVVEAAPPVQELIPETPPVAPESVTDSTTPPI